MSDYQSIAVLLLAAGEASRFGSPKQLADWHGKYLLQHVYDQASDIFPETYLVLGAHSQQIRLAIDVDEARIIHATDWRQGMGSVIAKALSDLEGRLMEEGSELDGVLLLLGDQPLITSHDLMRFVELIHRKPGVIVCSEYHKGEDVSVGVPAFFPKQCFGQLRDLSYQQAKGGAKHVIKRNAFESLSLGDRLQDIDTEEELARLRALSCQ